MPKKRIKFDEGKRRVKFLSQEELIAQSLFREMHELYSRPGFDIVWSDDVYFAPVQKGRPLRKIENLEIGPEREMRAGDTMTEVRYHDGFVVFKEYGRVRLGSRHFGLVDPDSVVAIMGHLEEVLKSSL